MVHGTHTHAHKSSDSLIAKCVVGVHCRLLCSYAQDLSNCLSDLCVCMCALVGGSTWKRLVFYLYNSSFFSQNEWCSDIFIICCAQEFKIALGHAATYLSDNFQSLKSLYVRAITAYALALVDQGSMPARELYERLQNYAQVKGTVENPCVSDRRT